MQKIHIMYFHFGNVPFRFNQLELTARFLPNLCVIQKRHSKMRHSKCVGSERGSVYGRGKTDCTLFM